MKSVLRIALLLAVSSLAASGWVSYRGLKWVPDAKGIRAHDSAVASLRRERGISLEQFKEMISREVVVIDARPRSEFEKSHLAIDSYPPVLNIEPNAVPENLPRLESLRGLPLVLYCTSSTCDLAEELYVNMKGYGFEEAVIFVPGWEGIQKAGLPITSGPDTFTGTELAESGADPGGPPVQPVDAGADSTATP